MTSSWNIFYSLQFNTLSGLSVKSHYLFSSLILIPLSICENSFSLKNIHVSNYDLISLFHFKWLYSILSFQSTSHLHDLHSTAICWIDPLISYFPTNNWSNTFVQLIITKQNMSILPDPAVQSLLCHLFHNLPGLLPLNLNNDK